MDYDNLKKCRVNLEAFVQYDNFSDLDGIDLFSELNVLQKILPKEKKSASDILNFIENLNFFLNAFIAYKILLTIHIIVAFAKEVFQN